MSKISSNLTLVILIITWLVMMAVVVACGSNPAATETPAVSGATLLETRCSTCHTADMSGRSGTRDQWQQIVTLMIDKGAKLTEAEKTVLVDYLTKTYGQ